MFIVGQRNGKLWFYRWNDATKEYEPLPDDEMEALRTERREEWERRCAAIMNSDLHKSDAN